MDPNFVKNNPTVQQALKNAKPVLQKQITEKTQES